MISSHGKRFSVRKRKEKKIKKRDRYGFRVGTDRECMEEKLVVGNEYMFFFLFADRFW